MAMAQVGPQVGRTTLHPTGPDLSALVWGSWRALEAVANNLLEDPSVEGVVVKGDQRGRTIGVPTLRPRRESSPFLVAGQ